MAQAFSSPRRWWTMPIPITKLKMPAVKLSVIQYRQTYLVPIAQRLTREQHMRRDFERYRYYAPIWLYQVSVRPNDRENLVPKPRSIQTNGLLVIRWCGYRTKKAFQKTDRSTRLGPVRMWSIASGFSMLPIASCHIQKEFPEGERMPMLPTVLFCNTYGTEETVLQLKQRLPAGCSGTAPKICGWSQEKHWWHW